MTVVTISDFPLKIKHCIKWDGPVKRNTSKRHLRQSEHINSTEIIMQSKRHLLLYFPLSIQQEVALYVILAFSLNE